MMENETKEEAPVEEKKTAYEKKKDVIAEANQAAERIEAANIKAEEILGQQKELHAKTILSGKSEAGTTEVKEEEETAQQYAARILRGKND